MRVEKRAYYARRKTRVLCMSDASLLMRINCLTKLQLINTHKCVFTMRFLRVLNAHFGQLGLFELPQAASSPKAKDQNLSESVSEAVDGPVSLSSLSSQNRCVPST